MTTRQLTTAARSNTTAFATARNVVRWPFTSRFASPLWLALRLYVAWIWIQMSISKFAAGWLTSDPSGDLLKLVAKGTMPVPFAFYRGVAAFMVSSGITPMLSHAMPFLEMAVALSLISGVLMRPASLGGILLVTNVILTGIGTLAFDGRVILIHVLLIAAYGSARVIGFERLAAYVVQRALNAVRPHLPERVARLAGGRS